MADTSSLLDSTGVSAGQNNMQRDDSISDNSALDESSFQADWQFDDTTLLQPTNLPIARVQRAWERRPQSPFARQKARSGAKVWKRGVATHNVSINPNRDQKNSYAVKAVKKQCLGSGLGLGAVSQWDSLNKGSPARKIVTRSDRSSELIELNEEDAGLSYLDNGDLTIGEPELEGTITEIVDEDGKVVSNISDSADLQWDGWEDVAPLEKLEDETTIAEDRQLDLEPSERHDTPDVSVASDEEPKVDSHDTSPKVFTANPAEIKVSQSPFKQHLLPTTQRVILPEGFVSPMKQRRKIGPRSLRESSSSSRRRTLPFQFAPEVSLPEEKPDFTVPEQPLEETMPEITGDDLPSTEQQEDSRMDEDDATLRESFLTPSAEPVNESTETDEDGWEDVSEEEGVNEEFFGIADELTDSAYEPADEEATSDREMTEDYEVDDRTVTAEQVAEGIASNIRDVPFLSSPVPTVTGQHPRLPLRRSPRRKSTSPLKQSSTHVLSDSSHLVAFTPIKRPDFMISSNDETSPVPTTEQDEHPTITSPMEDVVEQSPVVETAESQEQTRTSPSRSSKPRISDDTALLQAFLSKAAEKKTTRRVSTAMKESMSNRRDSDTVKQALASPAPIKTTDVLMELDVNSPSPRKTSFAMSTSPVRTGTMSSGENAQPASKTAEKNAEVDNAPAEQLNVKTRSVRSRKKPQVYTPVALSAPSRISIRGNTNSVDLKKTEAQEISLLTRSNTRKNKAGSVLPLQRLTKLAAEKMKEELPIPEPGQEDSSVESTESKASKKKTSKRRNVKWAEVLLHFSDAPPVEISQAGSDEEETSENIGGNDGDDATVEIDSIMTSAPLPMDTPSKPKVRRLRAARTASSAETSSTDSSTSKASARTTTRSKRSRIATPAKPKSSEDVLSAETAPVAAGQESKQASESLVPKKRKIPTRLPAPATASTTCTTSTSSLGLSGKENMLTASPAKKKPSTGGIKTFSSSANMPSKLDFGQSAKKSGALSLGPTPSLGSHANLGAEVDSHLGLASPAKKGRRAAPIFNSTRSAMPSAARHEERETLGLTSSPAKKRTRRGVL